MSRSSHSRVKATAKFFYEGAEKFWIRGATYGTFAPRAGSDYPIPERVAEDFALMRKAGINTVRIYTVPPQYLLDEAARQGLRVIVGLAWSQHICFLDDPKISENIRRQIRLDVRACANHPAVLAFAIGNEIPAQIVRWHGKEKIERFLNQLYDDVKREAPHAMVTYVNYPPTDYLDLSFLDFICFNVFLHREEDFNAYLAKLQNVAGHQPLVLTELGMDSRNQDEGGHGEDEQAKFLDWQLREAFKGGAAGVCVFSWTDDWYRGGNQITDWAFGLVDAKRKPKQAYHTVQSRFARIPFELESQAVWPKVSVVICAYNAASTIEDNLESLTRLNYPSCEVIVVNDGSKDATPVIAARYPQFKLISVPNGGLSAARNLGWRAATGEIIAYTDADTRVDPDWLSYLVQPFLTTDAVGVGGPNVVPEDDDWIAQCVARSPGGPTQVLLNDTVAEHIPGCNMAFRRWALEDIGGFDPTYTKAGDDVDVCWRLQEHGGHLAFSPSALVWHHHRNTVKAYWKQQVGYGEGESFLEHRHQEKFNERGQTRWQGRIYSHLPAYRSLFKSVVYQGLWGAEAFPSVYQGGVDRWTCLPQMVEWQALTMLAFAGAIFTPWSLALAGLMIAATFWQCWAHAQATKIDGLRTAVSPASRVRHRMMIAWMHYLQPWARLRGRIKGYFSGSNTTAEGKQLLEAAPWLSLGNSLRLLFGRFDASYWDTHYTAIDDFLRALKKAGEEALAPVRCDDGWGQDYDLLLRACRTYSFKVKLTAEDHGGYKRMFRARMKLHRRPRLFAAAAVAVTVAGCFAYRIGEPGLWTTAVMVPIALAVLLFEVSKRGGQALSAMEVVGKELKMHSLNNIKRAEREKNKPVFEES